MTETEAPQTMLHKPVLGKLPAQKHDAMMADIGRGVDTYTAIAARYQVAVSTVCRAAAKRGLPSLFSPRGVRTQAAERAQRRELRADKALANKPLAQLDADTLSRITERAGTTLHNHLAALERADTPAATITLSPELRLLVNVFVPQPGAQVAERNITYPKIEAGNDT